MLKQVGDKKYEIILTLSLLFLVGCSEIRTDDPTDSYNYWAGVKPTNDIKVLKGRYWQSAHWTREYILYLKFKATNKWWDEFVKQNQLQIDNKNWNKSSDSPDWFQVADNIEIYKHADDFNNSRYFRDSVTGECYIYEIQL
jgi:hypothetical protein